MHGYGCLCLQQWPSGMNNIVPYYGDVMSSQNEFVCNRAVIESCHVDHICFNLLAEHAMYALHKCMAAQQMQAEQGLYHSHSISP